LETIAVYWEPIIKTYGLFLKTDLSLVRISFPIDQTTFWGSRIQESDQAEGGFIMVVGHIFDGNRMQLSLLFENSKSGVEKKILETIIEKQPATFITVDTPVELIYFQGPHFGDRYGIADAAFTPFVENKVTILASGCASASIYIVVPEHMAQLAVKILSEKFIVPHVHKDHQ